VDRRRLSPPTARRFLDGPLIWLLTNQALDRLEMLDVFRVALASREVDTETSAFDVLDGVVLTVEIDITSAALVYDSHARAPDSRSC